MIGKASIAYVAALGVMLVASGCTKTPENNPSTRGQFLQFSVGSAENRQHALEWINDHWQPGFESMAVEALHFAGSAKSRQGMIALLQHKTGQSFGSDTDAWQRWVWQHGPPPHHRYAQVKATFIGTVDPSYRAYFLHSPPTAIRLDEVQWAGLRRSDDLPFLSHPEMKPAADSPLSGDQPVVGVLINGQARAYARGIIMQHDVVLDGVGDTHFMLIDDALTGSTAAYLLNGQQLAASGFVDRGDTLLYDRATNSLWSSLLGRPVVGSLVNKNIQLQQLPAVVTRWSEWHRRHPDSLVTADDPAQQNYLAGRVNYRKFIAKDRLIATQDSAGLDAEAEIIGLTHGGHALAVTLGSLRENPIYTARLGHENIAFLTSAQGATRAYLSGDTQLDNWLDADRVADVNKHVWRLTEDGLVDNEGHNLPRVALRHAHWAAWAGAYADTEVAR